MAGCSSLALMLALTTFAPPAYGQRAAESGRAAMTAQAAAADAVPSATATALVVRGTIEKYDVATGILSLTTANGRVAFPLTRTTRLRQRWHTLELAALESLTGYRAAVRYSDDGGGKVVESVHVYRRDQERPYE